MSTYQSRGEKNPSFKVLAPYPPVHAANCHEGISKCRQAQTQAGRTYPAFLWTETTRKGKRIWVLGPTPHKRGIGGLFQLCDGDFETYKLGIFALNIPGPLMSNLLRWLKPLSQLFLAGTYGISLFFTRLIFPFISYTMQKRGNPLHADSAIRKLPPDVNPPIPASGIDYFKSKEN